jgi:hypothetical protein
VSRFKDSEVLHNAEASHVGEYLAQFVYGQSIVEKQAIKQRPTAIVRECPEDIIHPSQYVTQQSHKSIA